MSWMSEMSLDHAENAIKELIDWSPDPENDRDRGYIEGLRAALRAVQKCNT